MAPKVQAFKFKRTVNASPAEVYRAFTNAMVLREWLCDKSHADVRKGGRIYLSWNSGYYTIGEYTALIPGKKVAFTWWGRNEPAATLVQVAIAVRKNGTTITLTHSGVGFGKSWSKAIDEFQYGWEVLLENLQSVLESGIDLRIARRPMLGISFGEPLTTESAAKLGVPVTAGLRLAGVLENMGAHAAGLQKDDVLVRFDGKKLSGYPDLVSNLQKHQAGDKVKVDFYRGSEKKTVVMELSPRPMPEVPPEPHALATAVQALYTQDLAELRRCCENVTEEEASRPPAPGEWSTKEVIAHLIATERDRILWLASLIGGEEPDEAFFSNLPVRVKAITAVNRTLPALLDQLEHTHAELLAAISLLPDEFAGHKGSYWRLGYDHLNSTTHTHDHLNQIQTAIDAARQ